jgi:hypothetical protein
VADLPATSRSRSRRWVDRSRCVGLRRPGATIPARKPLDAGHRHGLGESRIHVSGTQRLRLVLALGVVNLVLATVALGYGLSASPLTPGVGAVPTAGEAFATSAPTAPGAASPAPAPTAPQVSPAPNGPRPSEIAGQEQTPGSSVAPSPVPSAQPSPGPSAPVVTQPTPVATPGPIALVHNPATPTSPQATPTSPQATPAPPQATPTPTRVPVSDGPGTPPGCPASGRGQAASDGKACHAAAHKPKKDHHDNGRHRGAVAHRSDGQAAPQPAIAETRPASRTRHRLRAGRRTR